MTDALTGARPRVRLAHLPTPLERCDRLSEAIGGPPIWLKRDDCTGLAGGGNKTRKLEFLLGRAIADGATGVITFGALQSNHARQTAAACAKAGLSCDLVLTRMVPRHDEHYTRSGNVLLDAILGARVHVAGDGDDAMRILDAVMREAEAEGRRLSIIGPGGSDAIGALGYVEAAAELASQIASEAIAPARIVLAASTCGTAAGLIVGASLAGLDTLVDVVCVYEPRERTEAHLRELIAACADELGAAHPSGDRWTITDAALGDGYGIPSPACLAAIERLARTEGVLLDPVYTGKAFAWLLDQVGGGTFDERPLVFWHTGGAQGLPAYTDAFVSRTGGR